MYCPYPRQQRLSGDFIAIRREQAAWLLVTSLKDFPRAVKLYRQRMQIEETFRDLKSLPGLSRVRVQVLLAAIAGVVGAHGVGVLGRARRLKLPAVAPTVSIASRFGRLLVAGRVRNDTRPRTVVCGFF